MKYTMKKTLAFLLTLVMLVNIFPLSAFADPDSGEGGQLGAENVFVTVNAAGIDLSSDGSEYYITIGSNDELAPYQFKKLNAGSLGGEYGFCVENLNQILSDQTKTLFVLLKRYESGETPTPTLNGHDVVFNWGQSNTLTIGEDDYDFVWVQDESTGNTTITITKKNNGSGGGGGDEPEADEHTAIIKLGKGVNLGEKAFVVFYGYYKGEDQGRHGGAIASLPGASSGTTHTVQSGSTFEHPYNEPKTSTYTSGDKIDVVILSYDQHNNIQPDNIKQGQLPNGQFALEPGATSCTINGKTYSVTYEYDRTGNKTTIQIGDMPAYDVEINYNTTPALTEKYYILAGVDEGGFDFFAPVNNDGTVGAFSGDGLTEDGKLPGIQSLQIVKYTGSAANPTLTDLIGAETEWIPDGGDLGGFTVTYPESLEPVDNILSFTADSPVRYNSSITFYEANGNVQQSSAELNGNYFIVALDHGEPVYYASVSNYPTDNAELVFKDSNGNIRNISAGLDFEIRKVNNGGNVPFSEVVSSPAPTTLGKYVLTSQYNDGNHTCTFAAKKSDEQSVKVIYYLNNGTETDPNPEVSGYFYMIASVNDQPLYYAEVNTNGSDHSFSNGVDSFNGLPANAVIKLVEYTGASENPTLEELAALEPATKLSKYEWRRDESVTDRFVFKAVASNKLYVRVSTYEADNITPLVPEEPIAGQYYIRVPVREAPVTEADKDKPEGLLPQAVAYCMAPFTFDPETDYKDVELTKFVDVAESAFSDSVDPVDISNAHIDYYNVRVLRLQNDNNKPGSYEDAHDKENYIDDLPPDGWAFGGKEDTGDGCNVHLKRADKTPRYFVRLKFDNTTDPSDINLDGGAWLKVTVDHASGYYTYGFIKLSNAEDKKAQYMTVDEENGCIYIDIPVTEWKNADGTTAAGERYTGNEQGISVVLAAGPDGATPATVSDVAEHDYINSSEIAAYPTGTQNVDRLDVESDNYIDRYDVVTLHQNDDTFGGYTLEAILNGYNIVTLCPNKVASPSDSGASAFGDGDFLMEKHQMGGVLIRGDIIIPAGADATGLGDSPSITKPSVVGGYIPAKSGSFFNQRQNNNNGWNTYVGSVNTVIGDHYVNGQAVQDRGYTGTNTGTTIVDDDFVDWDRLQNMVINTSNALGEASSASAATYDKDNNEYTVQAGSNARINYPENSVVTINILVYEEDGVTLKSFEPTTGYITDGNGNVTAVQTYDYSDIPGTVVSNLGTGTYLPPLVKINGVPLTKTVEDGTGISLLWNYPNAKEIDVTTSVTPQFGHVVAPKAYIDVQGGNNSGCMVGNKVRSIGEGHLYPYKGATLIGFYGDLGLEKTVNGGKPSERQKYDFTLEKLTPSLTNSEYTERMSKLTGDNKEQRVFWQRLQTVKNEADPGNEDSDIISFEDISFDSAGTYYFRVYENPATITNTTLDDRQFLIECKVFMYPVDASHSELRMQSIKYYDIKTDVDLLNITSSTSGKHASLNFAAIGNTHALTWTRVDEDHDGIAEDEYCVTPITFDNDVSSVDYFVNLEGLKILEERTLHDKEFTFEMTYTMADGTEKTVTAQNDSHGTIRLPSIPFMVEDFTIPEGENSADRTVICTIREVKPTTPDDTITYDEKVITATVVVTYTPDGDPSFTHTVAYTDETGEPLFDKDGHPLEIFSFTNTYEAKISTDLKATKTITGKRSKFQSGDKWHFTVTGVEKGTENTDIPMPTYTARDLEFTSESELGEVDFGTIEFTKDHAGKTYVYTIAEDPDVTVLGVENDTTTRTVEITVTENDDGTLSLSKTPSSPAPFVNLDEGSTNISVQKVWADGNGAPVARTTGEAVVQLIAVKSTIEPPTPPVQKADLDVSVLWTTDDVPADAAITVSNGTDTITLTGPSYSGKFSDLTVGDNYTLTASTESAGVAVSDTPVTGTIQNTTNNAVISCTYTPEAQTKDLAVKINWTDNNAPENVTITASTAGQTVNLNSANGWTNTFTGLTIGNTYTVDLGTAPVNVTYTKSADTIQIENRDDNLLEFTATYGEQPAPTTVNLDVTINWNNVPSDISVQVTATNTSDNTSKSITLTPNGNTSWNGSIQDLTVDQNYTVVAAISGNNAGKANIINASQTIQITSSEHQVYFSGTYTEQQPSGATIPVTITWDNEPSNVTVTVTAVNGGDQSDTHSVTLSGAGTTWSGAIEGLRENQNYMISTSVESNGASVTITPPQGINYPHINSGTSIAYTGTYLPPVGEDKIRLTVIRAQGYDQYADKAVVGEPMVLDAGKVYVTVTMTASNAPASYSATNGANGNFAIQSNCVSNEVTIDFTGRTGDQTLTVACSWGKDFISSISVSQTPTSGALRNRKAVRYIASTAWPDISFTSTPDIEEIFGTLSHAVGRELQDGEYSLVGDEVTLRYVSETSEENWYHLWQNLPEYYEDDEGNAYELTYYVVELSATGAVENTYSWNEEHTECTITNTEEAKGTITLTKLDKDDNTKKLAGAKFDLYRVKTGEETADVKINTADLVTDDDGEITVEDLEPGTYYFVETQAAPGYVLPTGDNAKTATRVVAAGQASLDPLTVSMENQEEAKGEITLTKLDKDDNTKKLAGAKFDLYRVKTGDETADVKINTADLVTDDDGEITVEDLEPGTYYFVETTAPTGYVLPEDAEDRKTDTATILAGQSTVQELTIEFTNEYYAEGELQLQVWKELIRRGLKNEEFSFSLYQISYNGETGAEVRTPVEEGVKVKKDGSVAKFSKIIYTHGVNPANPDPEDPLNNMNIMDGSTWMFDEAGNPTSRTKTITYVIVEDKPTGDNKDDTVIYSKKEVYVTVKLTDDLKGTINVTTDPANSASFTFTNIVTPIIKVNAENKQVKLSDAHFTVYDKADGVADEFTTSATKPHELRNLEINEVYRLHEDVAPDGYLLWSQDCYFMILEDGKILFSSSSAVDDDGILIASDTSSQIEYDSDNGVIVMLDTQPEKPTFEKKIKDTNDTTGETSDWQDSADYDIGDSVPYRLKATLASNVTDYRKYHITFHDTLEKGLTFEKIDSVTVNGDALPENGYTFKKISDQQFDLTVTFNDGNSQITDTSLNGGTVEVLFTAILNEDAVIGGHGNVNKAYLEYSCNWKPEHEGETDTTEEDFVICFTYKVDVNKVDQDGNALKGAEFKLEKVLKDNRKKQIACVTAESGTGFSFNGLDDGDYILTETKIPEGYQGIQPVTFTVTAKHEVTWTKLEGRDDVLTELTGKVPSGEITFTVDKEKGSLTADVKNEADTTSATVKKVWADENNRDGIRQLTLKVKLLAGGQETGQYVTLSESNNWCDSISGLPKVKDGKDIVYTWKEDGAAGYTLTTATAGTLTILTNTHEAEETEVKVKKVWIDDGRKHQDGITVILYADGKLADTTTLSEANGWQDSWKHLKKNVNDKGQSREIKYTVAEAEIPEGYVAKITGSASTGFVITNTLQTGSLVIEKKFDIQKPEEKPEEEEQMTEIEVQKIWVDNDNADGNRPESITVHLYAGGTEIKTAKLTAQNGWKRKFGDLPKFVDGHPIKYSITEDPVECYVTEIHGFTITNRYVPELMSVSVRKVWNDEDNKQQKRPLSIWMKLSNGMSVILNEANGWTATITGLPARVNGKPAVYTWTEQSVAGYELESKVTEGNTTVFTNRLWTRPDEPEAGRTPKTPGDTWFVFEEYDTPLGVEVIINHVGDCFD